MSYFHKYPYLIAQKTPYARKMNALSNKIFVNIDKSPDTKEAIRSLRVLKVFSEEPLCKMKHYVGHYPRLPELGHLMTNLRNYGLFRDEHQDFKEDMARLRILRGKIPRPFGSGDKKSRVLFDTKK